MTDCAGYSFLDHEHESGVELKVKTDDARESYQVFWDVEMSSDLERSMRDPERTTEFAAMGLAVLLTLDLTNYKLFEVSRKGSGVDFYLYEEDGDDLDFGKGARLEISGIRKESAQNTLRKRVNIKLKQAEKSALTGKIAYISVSEFSKPQSAFVTK